MNYNELTLEWKTFFVLGYRQKGRKHGLDWEYSCANWFSYANSVCAIVDLCLKCLNYS